MSAIEMSNDCPDPRAGALGSLIAGLPPLAAETTVVLKQRAGFHITIGTGPGAAGTATGDLGDRLDETLRLVKLGQLYADRVTLCSPTSSMLMSLLGLDKLDTAGRIRLVEQILPIVTPSTAPPTLAGLRTYRQLKNKHHRTTAELLAVAKLERGIDQAWSEVTRFLDSLSADARIAGLKTAVTSGVLKLHPLHSESTDRMVQSYVDAVLGATTDSTTHPLFDDQTGNLVRLAIAAGAVVISSPGVAMAKETGLAADFLGRLPSLDAASVDEVLQIRHELARPLVRFRAAVMDFSEKIAAAPWDADFSIEAGAAYRQEVEPALLDLEDALKSQAFVRELVGRLLDKPASLTAGGTVLTGIISQAAHLSHLASLALTGGAAVAGATNLVGSLRADRHARQAKAEQNRLYFYYRAGSRLAQTN